ncbi:hypothetical protein WJS89_04015 [Sphingomicrobium sp. XHP0235]|uniref:hypothetical protein n=1 Tax=Sphingomicrobium aquimarinum TaxID=3133971 RepID=UPI0031FE48C0
MRHAVALVLPLLLLAGCEDRSPETPGDTTDEMMTAEPRGMAVGGDAVVDEEAVATLLYNELEDVLASPDGLTLQIGTADLDDDGTDEVLAYAMGPMLCGTGGCGLYVLRRAGDGYRILDEIGPSQLPVYELAPGADGWAELGVTVYGGGMGEQVMAVPHDAAGYADNPTVAPARPVTTSTDTVIIAAPVID